MKLTRKTTAVVSVATLALTLSACAQSDRGTSADKSSAGGSDTKDTITFGAAGPPSSSTRSTPPTARPSG